MNSIKATCKLCENLYFCKRRFASGITHLKLEPYDEYLIYDSNERSVKPESVSVTSIQKVKNQIIK